MLRLHPERAPVNLAKANFILDSLNISLKRLYASSPQVIQPFGQALTGLSGDTLASSVVVHRLTKAYEVPQPGNSVARKESSIRKVLERDTEGFVFRPKPGAEFSCFLQVRAILSRIGRHLKPTYGLVFPTGEGFTTLKGEKDLYDKLDRDEIWECSPSSFKYVSRIFYENIHMKRLVKKKFYKLMREKFFRDRRAATRLVYTRCCGDGRLSFRMMLSFLVDLVDCSRMTTVPKDNSKDRVITCEPFLTMICQLSYMRDMRNALRKEFGIDLEVLQDWHRSRIRSRHIATLDLRNASNQVWTSVVQACFPSHVSKVLLSLRTGVTQWSDSEYHAFNMYSPMGCGLTFDVMTWLLTAIARVFDPTATVFGDDIVCKSTAAARIVYYLGVFGLEVNDDKSFSKGNFRESCGAMVDVSLPTEPLIICYDLRRPENSIELYSVVNKLTHILRANQIHRVVKEVLRKARELLLTCVPRDALRYRARFDDVITSRYIYLEESMDFHELETHYDSNWQRTVVHHGEQFFTYGTRRLPSEEVVSAVCMLRLKKRPLKDLSNERIETRRRITPA